MADYKIIKWGSYEVSIIKTSRYCPECGKKEVYVEDDDGDYYQGPAYYCFSCKNQFTMPSSGKMNKQHEIKPI